MQWADKADFNETLAQLANLFINSFRSYLEDAEAHVGADMAQRILSGGPDLDQVQETIAAAQAAARQHKKVHGHTALPSEGEGDSDVAEQDGECKTCGAKKAAAAPALADAAVSAQ
jgi:hypothetical protein